MFQEQRKRKNDESTSAFSCLFLTGSFICILSVLAAALQMVGPFTSGTLARAATDSAVLPADLQATPDRYYVGSMKDGLEGWVGYGAIWIDGDSHLWIAPDWVATHERGPFADYEVRIRREGEYIILFRDSLGDHTWTPGVDSGWGVDKKTNLIPVKLR